MLVTPVSGHISFALNNSRHPISPRCLSPSYCSVCVTLFIQYRSSAVQRWFPGSLAACRLVTNYNSVPFCDGSFYDDSLLRPLSSRTEHSRLAAHHCRNSSVLSLLIALLPLFRCACVSSFSILV
jgi:hypothetical protein